MLYQIRNGDSPAIIARTYGVSMDALLNANPKKATTIVAGQRTWQSIRPGETIVVPIAGMVGATAADAVNALISAGSPCNQANVAFVCALQSALGVGVDGKYGTATASAAFRISTSAPPACSPRPSWWAPVGHSNCPTATASVPTVTPSTTLAPAAVLALSAIDPCQQANVGIVCAAQKALGVTVDGKYGTTTASAAFRLSTSSPPACSPRPTWWAPVGQSNCGGAAPAPAPTTTTAPAPAPTTTAAPAAVQALVGINPCDKTNLGIVCAAQAALKVTVDGKYGTTTAAAAKAKLGSSAPIACSSRPTWWAPAGQSNCTAAAIAATPATTTTSTTASGDKQTTTTSTTPAGEVKQTTTTTTPAGETKQTTTTTTSSGTQTTTTTTGGAITPPVPSKKLSTGAIVAGTVGAAALIGIVALAMHKPTRHRVHRAAKRAHHTVKRKISHRKRK